MSPEQDTATTLVELFKTMNGSPGPWMSSKEAAEFLKMNHSVFKEMAARDEIPRHEVRPGRYRYYAPELTDWLLEK